MCRPETLTLNVVGSDREQQGAYGNFAYGDQELHRVQLQHGDYSFRCLKYLPRLEDG